MKITESQYAAMWESIATKRDEFPRRPDDADTYDLIDAALDGLFGCGGWSIAVDENKTA